MSWYYTEDGVDDYYAMYKKSKELEKMRKAKKILDEKRKKQLKKERLRLAKKMAKEKAREDKKKAKAETMEKIKGLGYKKGYTRKNPLAESKRQRDLKLCQELYQKNKQGISRFKLAVEYGVSPITITRHIYEYEYYLNLKNAGQEAKDII